MTMQDLSSPFPDMPPPDILLAGRFEPAQARRYVHLPFEVFPGVRQLHLCYRYSDRVGSDPALTDGNTLDIGLFDERGIAPGGPGFRGWSGSSKTAFTIDRDWATPPYSPGPIGAGMWHVLLGPYKVWERGLGYEVGIWFNLGLPPEVREYARQRVLAPIDVPAPAAPGWYRGDLHCHTLHSDGDSWPADMLIAAAEAGLDFLGVTDHNTTNHHADYGPGGDGLPLVIPGVEVTTYGGHWNVWGTDRWYDFRDPSAVATAAAMREAVEAGGLVSVCHPRAPGLEWRYADRGFHAIEVWNGPWRPDNAASLDWWGDLIQLGDRVVAVGGSDTHVLRAPAPARLGRPTTWVQVEDLTAASVLEALRAGRSFISRSPAGPTLYRSVGHGHVRFHGEVSGEAQLDVLLGSTDRMSTTVEGSFDVQVPPRPGMRYVRAQLSNERGMLAVTNPLWLEG